MTQWNFFKFNEIFTLRKFHEIYHHYYLAVPAFICIDLLISRVLKINDDDDDDDDERLG